MKLHSVFIICAVLLVAGEAKNPLPTANKGDILDLILHRHKLPEVSVPSDGLRNIIDGSIEQRLDHFDDNNLEVFQQQFLSNYEHFDVNEGGPLFILVSGDTPIHWLYLVTGLMYELAQEHGAAMFYLEHRFYGSSFPANRTANLDTLQYFTTEQAINDLSNFITQIRYVLPHFNDAEIILFGYSIGGSLVTWYQKDYADTINGAFTSSAPVLGVVDFLESTELSGAVLRSYGGDACYDRVNAAFDELGELFDNNEHDRIREELNVCPGATIESERGEWTLNGLLSTEFALIGSIAPELFITLACDIIMNAADPLSGLAGFNEFFFLFGCVDFDYEDMYYSLSLEQWQNEFNLAPRLVMHQLCTQFGWYPSSTSDHQPFGSRFPVDLFYSICYDVFGLRRDEIIAGINATNKRYGGLTPVVKNLLSTQGMNDPMRTAGIQDNLSETARAIVIEDAGPNSDIMSYSLNPNVLAAQMAIRETIRQWLS